MTSYIDTHSPAAAHAHTATQLTHQPQQQLPLAQLSVYDNAERSLERKWKKYFGDRRPPLSFEPFNVPSNFEPTPVRFVRRAWARCSESV